MSEWRVELTEAAEKEIRALPHELQARFLHVAELLEELGPQRVREPYVKKLEGKLWEMRFKGRDRIARAIYFHALGKRLLVLRAFVKKTQKTPRREIELSLNRLKDIWTCPRR
ncbi:type II toxin-antitoxin system RelE/ParE family toxin [Fodinicurvata fenggangensis]|uniref:type II toxin-antitoxin system RelE/ParE family toxin n=1 Tax=Fodinicurvata fenggangensis TaxID=1121830 RepID=UPI00047D028E|nr:type II toxin-antitoxin system RelE/ParE family toxin [Fodinicurvata fenggangensis]